MRNKAIKNAAKTKKVDAKRDKAGRFLAKEKNYDGFWEPVNNHSYGSDSFGAQPDPKPADLVANYQDVVYACTNYLANNVSTAFKDIKLCITSKPDEPRPKCWTKSLGLSLKSIEKNFQQYTRRSIRTEEVVDHALLDITDVPNPHQSFHKLIALTDTFLSLCGSSFLLKVRNENTKLVVGLWVLPSQTITIKRDDKGRIESYVQQVGSDKIYHKPSDIIHVSLPNPLDPLGFGVSPVQASWQRIMLLRNEQSSWQAILNNIAFPSMLISPPDDQTGSNSFTDEQAKRISRQLTERFRYGEGGGTWVVQDQFQVTPLTHPFPHITFVHH